MTTLKIALTGGIAYGKSQVAQTFSQLGADVIQLDDVSKQVTMPNSQALNDLVSIFGTKILNSDTSLNRQILRKLLLENEHNKNRIEAILHPKILKIMQKWQENSKKPLNIVEIPLLSEKKLAHLFDRAIILNCSEKKQLERIKTRKNISKEEIKNIISIQTSPANRLKIAEELPCDIIENNGSLADLEQKTKQLYHKLINL